MTVFFSADPEITLLFFPFTIGSRSMEQVLLITIIGTSHMTETFCPSQPPLRTEQPITCPLKELKTFHSCILDQLNCSSNSPPETEKELKRNRKFEG